MEEKLLCNIQKRNIPSVIIRIKEDGYPVSKEQRIIVSEFFGNKFKKIDIINSIEKLINYLKDETVTKQINTEYLQKVKEKFEFYTDKNEYISLSLVYYKYMLFLLNVNKNSQNVNKRYVQTEMIYIQKVWQDLVYEKQYKNMHHFSYQQKIETEKLEKFSEVSLKIIYDEQHSFENIPDLLYIYNIMYNGNSCNIRNECIHGRDYLYGERLKFAFRATLFSIHMVEFRIRTIKENISDIIEITD